MTCIVPDSVIAVPGGGGRVSVPFYVPSAPVNVSWAISIVDFPFVSSVHWVLTNSLNQTLAQGDVTNQSTGVWTLGLGNPHTVWFTSNFALGDNVLYRFAGACTTPQTGGGCTGCVAPCSCAGTTCTCPPPPPPATKSSELLVIALGAAAVIGGIWYLDRAPSPQPVVGGQARRRVVRYAPGRR